MKILLNSTLKYIICAFLVNYSHNVALCQNNSNPYDLNKPQTNNQYIKQCQNGGQIKLQDLLNQRIPYDFINTNYNLPSACKIALQSKIKEYEKEDVDKWQLL